MKIHRLGSRLAVALVVGSICFVGSASGADKKDTKQSTTAKDTKSSKDSKPATTERKETVKEATTRMRSDSNVVDTTPRKSKFIGAANGGAMSQLQGMTSQNGTTGRFDSAKPTSGSTINTRVPAAAVEKSSGTTTKKSETTTKKTETKKNDKK